MFIGREKELRELNLLYRQERFQLFVLYGRRRVGKTTFLKEFCKGKPNIFYSAEQSNEKLNLEKFSELVFEHYGEKTLSSFESWEKALLYINARQKLDPLILVFDEFPYLANTNAALLSAFQHLIDHTLKEGKLFLVLCGSYMGFMEKEVLGAKSPLFGRRTAQLHMKLFDYKTSAEFLNGFSPKEQLMLYGAYGGTAMYLRQIDPTKPLKENITDSFLKTTGYLYEEPLLLLRQEVQEPGIYSAIIEAIAGGAVRANEISAKTGEASSKCLKYIGTLCELGILYKEIPFGEKTASRKSLYGVADFMFRFWYRYVACNRTLLETDAQEIVWKRKIEPDFSTYMGTVFERVCREYLLRQNSLGLLPILFTDIGRWWGTDSRTRKQVEIDLIARDGNDYLFCECKWRNEKLDLPVLHGLREKADAFLKKREHTWFVLFSKSGFTDGVQTEARERKDVILVTMEALFQ